MTSTLLRTKLHRPPLPPDVIERRDLLAQLEFGSSLPLTLVCSPAGFGKSTVVSAWLSSLEQPSAWISLDQKDDDAGLFLQYFIAAVRDVAPGACAGMSGILRSPNTPAVSNVAPTLINELDDVKAVFIIEDAMITCLPHDLTRGAWISPNRAPAGRARRLTESGGRAKTVAIRFG